MVGQQSAPAAKIALFRSLFRGREDVYPRRFESRRTGKSGYAPACANEWVRGICEKPRIKCAECGHRRFLPFTDDVIRWHLSGVDGEGQPFVAGVYAMLQDETTFFLAVDFDKQGWRDDAAGFRETCRQMGLTAALERSRSGRGGHVWLFFNEAVPAALARKLGSHILTETMEHHPDLGLDSYDRFFPSQDTLPHGGFGNLIALPLQKRPRERGNSVFIDDELAPYADQWAFLSTVPRIGRARAEDVVREAERRGRVVGVRLPPDEDGEDEPWALPPSRRRKARPIAGALPRTMELVLGNEIYIAAPPRPAAWLPGRGAAAAFGSEHRAGRSRRTVRGRAGGCHLSGDAPAGAASGGERAPGARYRGPVGDDGVRKDCHRCLAHRPARREHPRAGPSPTAPRAMD